VRAHFRSYASLIIKAWLLAHPSTCSAHFLTTFDICFDISHPTVPHLSWCQCGHTIDNLGIHLLYCFCGRTHFNPWYILKYSCNCHVKKWSSCTKKGFPPFLPPHTQKRIDIVITRNRFRTLADVVIVDPTHINLMQQASMTTKHWTTVAAQNKNDPTQNEC